MVTSQSVKANKAPIILSGLTLFAKWTTISTSLAVLSSTFLILILPLSLAFKILSISELVVTPNGSSRITSVLLSAFSILPRTRTLPPLNPLLYASTSAVPPVGKSGYSLNPLPRRVQMLASMSSMKLCGSVLHANPTAMPSTPEASKRGNLTGRTSGSLFRPS